MNMLVFPQLATGAAALYPLRRRTERRTVINTTADGSSVVYADPDYAVRKWDLQANGLRGEEWDAVEALFDAVKGPLGTFTFLEPAGNLLAKSEEFSAAEWDNDPLIGTTAGIDDPFGGTRATRVLNSSSALAGVKQNLPVPGTFQYAMSVWARAVGAAGVTLAAMTAGGSGSVDFALSSTWRRVSAPVDLSQATESVTFAALLGPGDSVDLFGMQVEAQPAASAYQKTGARGGVHSHARFASTVSSVRAHGTDVYDALIQIVSRES